MALIKCAECGQEISDSSKRCPHCGCKTSKSIKIDRAQTKAERQQKAQEEWENASEGQKTFSMIFLIILIVAGLFLFKSCGSSSSKPIENSETNAKICAEEYVRQNLKAPSTAKFCSYANMTATNITGRTWKVSGYVDAENSFGASIRTYWVVTLTLTNSGFKDATVSFA